MTILLIGAYGMMIWRAFCGQATVLALPPLDSSFIWLIGVSHASYLAYKATSHTA